MGKPNLVCPKLALGTSFPELNPKTPLFAKATLLLESMVAQNFVKN
jgi:hypothetical protein